MQRSNFEYAIGTVEKICRRSSANSYTVVLLKGAKRSLLIEGFYDCLPEAGDRIEVIGYFKATRRPEYRNPLFQAVYLNKVSSPDWGKVAKLAPKAQGEQAEVFWSLHSLVESQGGSSELAQVLFESWGDQALANVREAPYETVFDCGGDFPVADRLGRFLGYPPIADERIRKGALHLLSQQDGEPLAQKEFRDGICELLSLPGSLLADRLRAAELSGTFVIQQGKVYLPGQYEEEPQEPESATGSPEQVELNLSAAAGIESESDSHEPIDEEPGGEPFLFDDGNEEESRGEESEVKSPPVAPVARSGEWLNSLGQLRDFPTSPFLFEEFVEVVRRLEGPATTLSDGDRQIPLKVLLACGPAHGLLCAAESLIYTIADCGGRIAVCAPHGQALQRANIDAAQTRIALVSPKVLSRLQGADMVVVTEADSVSPAQWDMLVEAIPAESILLVLGEGRGWLAQIKQSGLFAVLEIRSAPVRPARGDTPVGLGCRPEPAQGRSEYPQAALA